MDFFKKNKIAVVIVIVIVVVVGGFLVLKKGGSQTANTPSEQQQKVKQLKPEDIGLVLSLRDDKKAVELKASKLNGVKSIEYEVSYNAKNTDPVGDSEDGATGDIPRGVVASPIDINGQSEISKEILLGTCSRNVCKYDDVTSDIKFIIKVNYTNGEVGSIETSLPVK